MKQIDKKLYFELYCHFYCVNEVLEEKYEKLSEDEKKQKEEIGHRLIEHARKYGPKDIYYEAQSLAIDSVMKKENYDFQLF